MAGKHAVIVSVKYLNIPSQYLDQLLVRQIFQI